MKPDKKPKKRCALFCDSAVDDAGLKPSEFRVLCHVGRRGDCYAAVQTIASHCQLNADTVRKCLKKLVKMGWLMAKPQVGNTTLYKVNHTKILDNKKDTPPENKGGHPYENKGGHPYENKGDKSNPIKSIQLNEGNQNEKKKNRYRNACYEAD